MVSDEDYSRCLEHGWYFDRSVGYVRRNKQPSWFLHTFIMGDAPPGLEIDHEDRNKLNNQRTNLRFVTRLVNAQNSKNTRGTLRYIYPNRQTWQVQVRRNHKTYNLGTYNTLEEAQEKRDTFLKERGEL